MTTLLPERKRPPRITPSPKYELDPEDENEPGRVLQPVRDVLQRCEISTWDFLIVGDGSATVWTKTGGWASVLVRRQPLSTKWFFGSFSASTNILAELMACLQPLIWLSEHRDLAPQRVHIISDCGPIVKIDQRRTGRNAHNELWQMFDAFQRRGLLLEWHHHVRDVLAFNKMSHDLANVARRSAIDMEPQVQELSKKHLLTQAASGTTSS